MTDKTLTLTFHFFNIASLGKSDKKVFFLYQTNITMLRSIIKILLSFLFTFIIFAHAALPHEHDYQHVFKKHLTEQGTKHCFSHNEDITTSKTNNIVLVNNIITDPICLLPDIDTDWTIDYNYTYIFSYSSICIIKISPTRGSPVR